MPPYGPNSAPLPPPKYSPIDIPVTGSSAEWGVRLKWATAAFMILGISARLVRYLLRFPLSGDECHLAVIFLQRGYLDLLQPLDYDQVCPLLLLWIELFIVRVLGFSEWSLRLFPCVSSLAAVCLFRHIAGRFLRGVPLLLAVAIFAVSYYPIRHGAEVKPYASDLAVSLVLLALATEWWHRPNHTGWLWALVAAVPFAIALSHPAVFVAGGLSVALLPGIWQSGDRRHHVPYLLYNVVLVGSFLVLLAVFTDAQYRSGFDVIMGSYWSKSFPPLAEPFHLAGWMLRTHTGRMFSYPVGAEQGGSTLTFLLFVAGAVALVRRRWWAVLCLLVAPFGLNFVAAAFQRYPYGGSARVSLYLAPSICLLAGLGAASLLACCRRQQTGRFALVVSALCLGGIGMGSMVRDLVHPYKTSHDLRDRDFARWFWRDKATGAVLVCATSDMEETFFPRDYRWRALAQYLCNQRIYSRRHLTGSPPAWGAVSAERPLRCAVFSIPWAGRDEAAFRQWLERMQESWDLAGYERHHIHKFHRGSPPEAERVELFEFVPKGNGPEATALELGPKIPGRL